MNTRNATISLAATLGIAAAAAAAPRYDCEPSTYEPVPPRSSRLNGPSGEPLMGAACGASKAYEVGLEFGFEVEIDGFTFGVKGAIDTSFTVTAQPCHIAYPVVTEVGAKVKVTKCKGWWWWEHDEVTYRDYIPGARYFAIAQETSEEIRCMCEQLGSQCGCGEPAKSKTGYTPLDTGGQGAPSVHLALSELRHGDITGAQAAGFAELSRLELRMLSTIVQGALEQSGAEDVALASADGLSEWFSAATVLGMIAEREEQILRDGTLRDINRDGAVDELDLRVIFENLGSSLADGGIDMRADLDADAKITDADIAIFMQG